jgi:hypothetical protein
VPFQLDEPSILYKADHGISGHTVPAGRWDHGSFDPCFWGKIFSPFHDISGQGLGTERFSGSYDCGAYCTELKNITTSYISHYFYSSFLI